eukprot:scaffold1159_cov215-Pinguiococcus_pyrenoidosus.AAC.24
MYLATCVVSSAAWRSAVCSARQAPAFPTRAPLNHLETLAAAQRSVDGLAFVFRIASHTASASMRPSSSVFISLRAASIAFPEYPICRKALRTSVASIVPPANEYARHSLSIRPRNDLGRRAGSAKWRWRARWRRSD